VEAARVPSVRIEGFSLGSQSQEARILLPRDAEKVFESEGFLRGGGMGRGLPDAGDLGAGSLGTGGKGADGLGTEGLGTEGLGAAGLGVCRNLEAQGRESREGQHDE
jgi:hypothetical protein